MLGRNKSKIDNLKSPSPVPLWTGSIQNRKSKIQNRLTPTGYWLVHQEADMEHQILGLELIPECERNSLCGRVYAHTVWEVFSLWNQEFYSWSGMPIERKQQLPMPTQLAFKGKSLL
jgi:hypothetical protein